MPVGIIDLRPQHPASEWDASTLRLVPKFDPPGFALLHVMFGQYGTEITTCVLFIPDELFTRSVSVAAFIQSLKDRAVKEQSEYTRADGTAHPFGNLKYHLRDDETNRVLIDGLREALDGYLAERQRGWHVVDGWPTYENPVGVFQ